MAGQILVQRGAGSVGGGSGTPGGSNTQVQYNDGGVFGGDAGLVFDEATDLLTADHVLLAQGTITDPEPNLEGTVTWNDGADTFTAWKLNVTNTNSQAESNLIDLQVGGTSKFRVNRNGKIETTSGGAQINLSAGGTFLLQDSTLIFYMPSPVEMRFAAEAQFGFSSSTFPNAAANDTIFKRNEAAGQVLLEHTMVLKESTTNPSAANLTSGSNAKDRLGWYMKADKIVFAYNNAGTVTYVTLDLDGSDTTWSHSTTAP